MPTRRSASWSITAHEQGKTLEQLSLAELQDLSPLFGEDVYTALDMQNCMEQRKSYGGPAIQETTRQIEAIAAFIEERYMRAYRIY